MKAIFAILLAIITCCIHNPSYAQITLNIKNGRLKTLFSEIESQTKYTFFYDSSTERIAMPVSISVTNADIHRVLQICFKGQPIVYKIDSLFIVVLPIASKKTELDAGLLGFGYHYLTGSVVDSANHPLPGANIAYGDQGSGTTTDSTGKFKIIGRLPLTITISHIGYSPKIISLRDTGNVFIRLFAENTEVSPVTVYSTGYQKILPEQATGAYDYVDNSLIDRAVSTDILSRLDGIASGVLFSPVVGSNNNASITIGGRSTIFSNPNPLIVLDNFPFSGNVYDINPNDIESITILKDAAAASIWGVQAGNGVIVITTRHGQLNRKPKLTFNTNITLGGKPDLWSIPQVNSNDFINLQEYLYNQGYFDFLLQFIPYLKETPVVDLLDSASRGLVTKAYAQNRISQFRNLDVRYQQSKYLYRPSVYRQYSVSVQGGTQSDGYYASIGFDNNIYSSVGSSYKRFTGNMVNNLHLAHDKVLVTANLSGTVGHTTEMAYPYIPNYPYEQIADGSGKALPVYPMYRQAFSDTAGGGLLRNWAFYPLDERNGGNVGQINNGLVDLSIRYKLLPFLSITVMGEYQIGASNKSWNYGSNSYFVRNTYNLYAVTNYQAGTVSSPIPLGGIDVYFDSTYNDTYGRLQLDLNKQWGRHQLDALVGTEANVDNAYINGNANYGVGTSSPPVNYTTSYPVLTGGTEPIPNYLSQTNNTTRYRSFYGNAAYSFRDKYHITFSARRDEANIFGADANHRGVPLASIGVSWDLDKERFYHFGALPKVRFRFSDGYNGNAFNALTVYTTGQIAQNPGTSIFGIPYSQILNPPDPDLGWERVHIYNFATDFSLRKGIVAVSLDIFKKIGLNLIGNAPTAAQTGVTSFTGNNASTRTNGLDITLHSINIKGDFCWATDFLWSYARDIVSQFREQQTLNALYILSNYTNPLQGHAYEAVFSLPFKGLDSLGNPVGMLNGKMSESYSGILNATNTNNILYSGSYIPAMYGAFRNSFSYKHWDISVNIKFKLGYVFRRGGLDYWNLFAGGYSQQPGYDRRWRKPGDEHSTNVPSLIYPDNSERDLFYLYSSSLVDRADQIRWQDIRLSYTMKPSMLRRSPFSNLRFYGYINNVCILWRANKDHLDPDAISFGEYGLPLTRSVALGLRCDLK